MKKERIPYEKLLEVFLHNAWETPNGRKALYIESRINASEKKTTPRGHLKQFLNSYLVEKEFWLEFDNLQFINIEYHVNLYEGSIPVRPDFYDVLTGELIDVKTFTTYDGFIRYTKCNELYKAEHGADKLYIFVIEGMETYIYDCHKKTIMIPAIQIKPELL